MPAWWGEATDEPGEKLLKTAREDARPTDEIHIGRPTRADAFLMVMAR
jgi:hypothetical protein